MAFRDTRVFLREREGSFPVKGMREKERTEIEPLGILGNPMKSIVVGGLSLSSATSRAVLALLSKEGDLISASNQNLTLKTHTRRSKRKSYNSV